MFCIFQTLQDCEKSLYLPYLERSTVRQFRGVLLGDELLVLRSYSGCQVKTRDKQGKGNID